MAQSLQFGLNPRTSLRLKTIVFYRNNKVNIGIPDSFECHGRRTSTGRGRSIRRENRITYVIKVVAPSSHVHHDSRGPLSHPNDVIFLSLTYPSKRPVKHDDVAT